MKSSRENYTGDRLTINISGTIYQTRERTLARFPDSLLGDPMKRQKYYCAKQHSYYFNRHRRAFDSILYYYQSGGRLVIPRDIPLRLFFEEVEFFGLGDDALCLVSKGLYARKIKVKENLMPIGATQRRIWETFECPESSKVAKVLSVFCIVMIVLSIVLSCLTTSAYFQDRFCVESCPVQPNLTVIEQCCTFFYEPNTGIATLDLICYCWFLIEYFCRFLSSPSKRQFILSFLNLIDVLVILPFFFTHFIDTQGITSLSSLLGVSKLLRLTRIIKLSRYSRGLKALGSTLCASFRELKMMMMFLIMVVIVSSCLVYLVEMKHPQALIKTVPDGFWWSLTTITTVGYGDYYPVTGEGKLIGCLCTILGALAFSLPVIVLAANFRTCYKSDDSISAEYHRNLRRQAYRRW
ncbi:potassium voltage-gated channel subfamily A member 2-like [Paramuricea clavata]|uniref:Potassium voltage-gated channel subfamily A member 2-like n=1 Tax=Paramuricea clavata TaxID=317549 RepID=A0A6S7K7R9_PARCT|nr:potassium voltage-gated channel subfamily A member 2-like [Paramuricea clavata]